MNLLSSPSLVESPFIVVKIGDYTFGKYSTLEDSTSSFTSKVVFPDYMESIDITKINGAINTYNIVMTYGITRGDDPNLLEKVFGSVSKTRKIYISYGDCNAPSFIYREEEAIISSIKTDIDIGTSRIKYTLSCVSSSLALQAGSYDFPAYQSAKPSDIIKRLLETKIYGLTDIFYGMQDINQVNSKKFILDDDKAVKIEAKQKMNVLDYLNYLVNCMVSITNPTDSIIRDSRYYLTIIDSTREELPGPYFKITKVFANTTVVDSPDTFEADIGYPGTNLVTSFSIANNESWSILYDYSEQIDQSKYMYRIDNEGKMEAVYSPNVTTSKTYQYSTEASKTWWSNMTNFPINATMTIKGLIRPATLMNYIRIRVWFYGAKHSASGLYVITKQQDKIDSSGYKTTLSLTRVGGDTLPSTPKSKAFEKYLSLIENDT